MRAGQKKYVLIVCGVSSGNEFLALNFKGYQKIKSDKKKKCSNLYVYHISEISFQILFNFLAEHIKPLKVSASSCSLLFSNIDVLETKYFLSRLL